MELSKLSNKELKGILRENQVKNYSKLNKKELVKKVNQLTREQNGGKSGKGKNRLKDLIGGEPDELKQSLLSNNHRKQINGPPAIYTRESTGYQPPSPANIPITQNEKNKATLQQQQQLSAPLLSENEQKKIKNNEEKRQINEATRRSLENQSVNQPLNQVNNNEATRRSLENQSVNQPSKQEKNECGLCTIQ